MQRSLQPVEPSSEKRLVSRAVWTRRELCWLMPKTKLYEGTKNQKQLEIITFVIPNCACCTIQAFCDLATSQSSAHFNFCEPSTNNANVSQMFGQKETSACVATFKRKGISVQAFVICSLKSRAKCSVASSDHHRNGSKFSFPKFSFPRGGGGG